MNEPKIEFKKVKTFQGMEGFGMNADIYINDVKCFFMRDAGDGGMVDFNRYDTRININPDIESNVQLVNAWIATLPDIVTPLKTPHPDGRTELRLKMDYELYFGGKFSEFINGKEQAKFEKKKQILFKTAIVFGNPETPEKYSFLDFKKPLSSFPKTRLQQAVLSAKIKYCKGNVQILNKTELAEIGIIC